MSEVSYICDIIDEETDEIIEHDFIYDSFEGSRKEIDEYTRRSGYVEGEIVAYCGGNPVLLRRY